MPGDEKDNALIIKLRELHQEAHKASDEQNRTRIKKVAMLLALRSTLGVVTPALEACEVGRTQFYQWKKDDEEFCARVDEMDDISLDFSESKLHKAIKNDNLTAAIFHLKCKGKKRGYVEKQELETTNLHTFTGKVNFYIPDNGRDAKQNPQSNEGEEDGKEHNKGKEANSD